MTTFKTIAELVSTGVHGIRWGIDGLVPHDHPIAMAARGVDNTVWCAAYPIVCAEAVAKTTTYSLTNAVASTVASSAFWAGKEVLTLADWAIKRGLSSIGLPTGDPYGNVARQYHAVAAVVNDFANWGTSFVAPNYAQLVAEYSKKYPDLELLEKLDMSPSMPPPAPFSAIDLLAPTLFSMYTAKKAASNLYNSARHVAHLAIGVRSVRQDYKKTAYSNMSEGAELRVGKSKSFPFTKLVKEAGMEALFASLWGTTSYLTVEGMADALEAAGTPRFDAYMKIAALMALIGSVPTVWKTVMSLAESTEYKSSVDGMVYTNASNNPTMGNPSTKIDIGDALQMINPSTAE